MSGGVDSAVAAWLLKKEVYDVHGVVLRLWEEDSERDKIWTERTCCHVPMVHYLCLKILDIPFEVFDVVKDFQRKVVEPFQAGYKMGETPNPCTTCNAEIKIRTLMEIMEGKGFDSIATGHYARWKYSRHFEATGLGIAEDPRKDQSYFLARTREIVPENFLLPLGDLTKDKVRDIAFKAGFPVSGMLENQEACFVSEKRIPEFLEKSEKNKISPEPWNATDTKGRILGTLLNGIGLTRGQRRGVGIAGGEKLYVLNVLPESRKIILCSKDQLLESSFSVKECMGPLFDKKENILHDPPLYVRFRSTMAPVKCQSATPEGSLFTLEIPHDGIVPGQIAVFSDSDGILVGSGVISKRPA